jgi:hypothetical protein
VHAGLAQRCEQLLALDPARVQQHHVDVLDGRLHVAHEDVADRLGDVLNVVDHQHPARGEQRRAHVLGQGAGGELGAGDLGHVGIGVGGPRRPDDGARGTLGQQGLRAEHEGDRDEGVGG